VQTGHGDRFPVVASPDVAYVTLENSAGTREIIKITARASGADAMTVTRGEDGTTATTWSIGDAVEQRLPAILLRQFATANEQLTSVTGTDTIAGTAAPGITAYATNQMFRWIASGTNTGAATLNVNGLGAKSIYKAGATELASGEITSGSAVAVMYDGTQFQLVSRPSAAVVGTSGTFSTTLGVTGASTLTGGIASLGTAQSFTATATGLTTSLTGTVYYRKVGDLVTLDLPIIGGTSNATTFTLTGMPAAIIPATLKGYVPCSVSNAGTYGIGLIAITTGGEIAVFSTANGDAFTDSGGKTLLGGSISYTLN